MTAMLVGDVTTCAWRVNPQGQLIRALLGSTETIAKLPHAQVVEQPGAYVQRPHFHEIDQYQVIVGGSGHIGRRAVGLGDYHYTDRATTYGPIIGDADGINYLVLRPRGEHGVDIRAKFMPESRAIRSRPPGRHRFGTASAPEPNAWHESSNIGDGALVLVTRVEPGGALFEPVDRHAGGPGYLVALRGEFATAGRVLSAPSVIWLEVGDPWPNVVGTTACVAGWFSFARAWA